MHLAIESQKDSKVLTEVIQKVYENLLISLQRPCKGYVISFDEFKHIISSPFNSSIWGVSLATIMEQQSPKTDLDIPCFLAAIIEKILSMPDWDSEGIFRIAGNTQLVNQISCKIDLEDGYSMADINEVSVATSLLKNWLRSLQEPVIPRAFYQTCINSTENPLEEISKMPGIKI